MSEATKCDRCGAFVDRPVTHAPMIEYSQSIVRGRKKLSLCDDCYEKFIEFLEQFGRCENDLSI